ncbi:hypothetical protein ARMA_0619 [Ardenticatena maritima]|uniref:HTH merR-type domain-containing protein n=1 Tax=Ardenticatena maritima TaxID=872965 RepID=A0A0M8K811_9CHLR|nr:B12-binding domain-containing protein [Ardenticatena maritima]GAP62196.1 hypothetical protein ARMA_0619 [Ardenticatena maritima]
MYDTTPTYNLKAVVQRTGVKPDTLRVWERRYGLPKPHRKPSGHRLYSEYDIAVVEWLRARLEEGMRISEAVSLWQQIEREGNDPLHVMPVHRFDAQPPVRRPAGHSQLDASVQAWLDAVLNFDEQNAEAVLTEAFALYPPETVVLQLIRPALHEIGERWYRGEVSVQQEHFASALVSRRLSAMMATMPPPWEPGSLLLACAPDELHSLPLLMLAFLLRRHGVATVYLGANVPADRLMQTYERVRPRLVVLTAQHLTTAARLADVAELLASRNVVVAYGGRIFAQEPLARRFIRGLFLGESMESALAHLLDWVRHTPALPNVPALPPTYREAWHHFRAQQPFIAADVIRALQADEHMRALPISALQSAVYFLGGDLEAVLRLGDVQILGSELEWVETLLVYHNIPRDALYHFLRMYQQAAQHHLDERGQIVIEWLQKVVHALAA